MTAPVRRLALATVLPALLAAAVPSAAHAAADRVRDPRGDVPDTAGDIVSARFSNGTTTVRAVVRVRDLTERSEVTVRWDQAYDGVELEATRSKGRTKLVVRHFAEDTSPQISCPAARVRWSARKDTVTFTAPQSCYPFEVPASWDFMVNATARGSYDYDFLDDAPTIARG